MNRVIKYYRRSSLGLGFALLSLGTAASLQIKYWVYFSHDCVLISPYAQAQKKEHTHKQVPSRYEQYDDLCIHPALQTESNSEHDHNNCSICQSFQHLLNAIPVVALHSIVSSDLQAIVVLLPESSFHLDENYLNNSQARAPPFPLTLG